MRKVAILAALTIVAALPTPSNAAAKKAAADPAVAAQKNTADFLRDALNPYDATKPKAAKAKKGKG
jgi:hypothetical protein